MSVAIDAVDNVLTQDGVIAAVALTASFGVAAEGLFVLNEVARRQTHHNRVYRSKIRFDLRLNVVSVGRDICTCNAVRLPKLALPADFHTLMLSLNPCPSRLVELSPVVLRKT